MSDNESSKSQPQLAPPDEIVKTIAAEMGGLLTEAQASLAAITEVENAVKVVGSDSQRVAAETNATVQTLLADTKDVATQALALKTQLQDIQAVIATKSTHIEDAKTHADTVRAELDRTLTAATAQATEAEGLKARAQTASDAVAALLTAITAGKGQSDTEIAAMVVARDSANETNATVQALLADIKDVSTQALALKTQLQDTQTVIATKSNHIEDARAHADTVRAELDRTLTAATAQATETEGLKARAQTASDAVATLLTAITAGKGQSDTEIAAMVVARDSANESVAALKGMSDKAETVQQRIHEYEQRLAVLEGRCDDQLKTITDLLPGATSAGLAHAFDDRRKTFFNPAWGWQWVFVGSLVLLIALALSGLWHVYDANSVITYDELGRLWLARLPVAGALVWLALHASRESALAKRLEEDYGYKAAIASSFLGFHKQMHEITTKAGEDSPLSQLCGNTLDIIATPPGRIYEKHSLIVTPGNEIKDAATAVLPKSTGS